MDLLLTHGYFLGEDRHEQEIMRPYPPLGLLYLSSHLKAAGLDVDVFDTTFQDREAFHAHLARSSPSVVGIYGNLMTRRTVVEMTRLAHAQGAIVVLGGPEPASYAQEYLSRAADVIVVGEGELTMEELVPRLLSRGSENLEDVAGIVYRRDDGEIIQTVPRPPVADLDGQPWPDRSAIDIDTYVETWRRHHGMGSVSLITARGCPFHCSWCSHGVFGYSHRRHSPAGTAEEVRSIVDAYDPEMLWYADDVFTINKKWIRDYAVELRRRGLRVPFETISREDCLDEETVRILAEMGCLRLWIGAESGSQRVLDAMKRQTDAKRLRAMIRLLQDNGIEAGTFIMLGYEGETSRDIEDTVEHLKAALPDQFLTTVAYPIKGTPYYDLVADKIRQPRPWDEISERDLLIAGRHSRGYYDFATRWMVNEVTVERWKQGRGPSLAGAAKAFANARIGRLGMRLTSTQTEAL